MSRATKSIDNLLLLEFLQEVWAEVKAEIGIPDIIEPHIRLSHTTKKIHHAHILYEVNFATKKIIKAEIVVRKDIAYRYGLEYFKSIMLHEIAHLIDLTVNWNYGHGITFRNLCLDLGGVLWSKSD